MITKAADIIASGMEFHWSLEQKIFGIQLQHWVRIRCWVTFPLTGLSFIVRFSLSDGTTSTHVQLRILYMKASRLTGRRSSRGSNFSCWSRAVTLVFWSRGLVSQHADLLWVLHEFFFLTRYGNPTMLLYSTLECTNDMYRPGIFSSCIPHLNVPVSMICRPGIFSSYGIPFMFLWYSGSNSSCTAI